MLKDRDYDVTPRIILILSLTCTSKCTRGRRRSARWILSAKSARCTVKMVGEECEVVRGVGVGENVGCSVTRSGDIWW